MVAGALAGCSSSGGEASGTSNSTNTQDGEKVSTESAKISMWMSMPGNASITSMAENEMFKELQKQTNVEITFEHPATGTAKEQFNLMLATGDVPDVIFNASWSDNISKVIQAGIAVPLDDMLEEFAPNYLKVLNENPEVKKQLTADDGHIYVLPHLRLNQYRTAGGLIIRQDLLDKVGMQAPETLDEWETVMKAFKDAGVAYPFVATKFDITGINSTDLSSLSIFATAYGMVPGFYIKDGKVQYGSIQQDYKLFLERMAKWYKEGLLDPDSFTNDSVKAKVTNGKGGAFFGYIGGNIGGYKAPLQENVKDGSFASVQYPVLNKGEEPQFTDRAWEWASYGAIITSSNKYPKETLRMLDYLYSEKGNLLKNFGIEGESYTLKDGYPTYTDVITKNPDKLTMVQALLKYTHAPSPFVGLEDDRYIEQYYTLPEQLDALNTLNKYSDNTIKVKMPNLNMTSEEKSEYAEIITNIETYSQELVSKFIMGAEPISNYDKFVDQQKKMKIERAIELQQQAYDRYKGN